MPDGAKRTSAGWGSSDQADAAIAIPAFASHTTAIANAHAAKNGFVATPAGRPRWPIAAFTCALPPLLIRALDEPMLH